MAEPVVTLKWIGNLKGPQGDRGAPGRPGSIQGATVKMLPAGAQPRVYMTGPEGERIAHFELPRGLPGLNAVPTDEAIATLLRALDTDTNEAAHALISRLVPAQTAFGGGAPTDWSPAQTIITRAQIDSVMGPAGQGTVPYLPHIMKVPVGTPGKLGEYYLYWSTDHSTGAGGIHMAYADHPLGPWTVVNPATLTIPGWMDGMPNTGTVQAWRGYYHRNRTVYTDLGYTDPGGTQTEGPWVMPDLSGERRFIMYYQVVVPAEYRSTYGVQATCFAKSDDGINWVRGRKPMPGGSIWNDFSRGMAFIYPPRLVIPGDGHSGYAAMYDIGQQRIGYSLAGGTQWSRQAVWLSGDGMSFRMDPRRISYRADVTGTGGLKCTGLFRLIQWRGEVWGYTRVENPGAGTTSPTITQAVVGRMRPDLRDFSGAVYESDWKPHATVDGGDGYLYGVGTQGAGQNRTIIARRLRA